MALIYKFKKERLESRNYVTRPRILVMLPGKNTSIEVPALIDSGADVSFIPESLAKAVGLEIKGEKTKLFAYRESNDVITSQTDITFIGRAERESIKIRFDSS